MSRMKELLLTTLADGEPVPSWPPAIYHTPPSPPRTPLGYVPRDSARHFWPYHMWMKVGLTPYARSTTKRGRRRRRHWMGWPLYRKPSVNLVNGSPCDNWMTSKSMV
jgi:hypothetical protein